jgi:hypothetical protein
VPSSERTILSAWCIGGEVCELSPAGVPQNEVSKRLMWCGSYHTGTAPDKISPLERGFKSSYPRCRHRYLSPRHHKIVNTTQPDGWPRYLQYIRGSHHPPKASSLVCRGREVEEGTVRGSNNLSQERKAVLSAGLGSSALGTTGAVHPDQRMLTLRRTRLAYR